MKERLLSLDAIKGIAILLVLIDHVYVFCDSPDSFTYSFIQEFILAVHMPLFIILAGFFSRPPSKDIGWIKFIQDKAIRLVIPALIWHGLWTIWHDGGFRLMGVLTNQYWFTLNLFIYFIAFGLQSAIINFILKLTRHRENSVLEICLQLAFMIAAYYLLADVIPKHHPLGKEILSEPRIRMACLYPYFIIGYAIKRLELINYLRTQIGGAISLSILVACIWIFTFSQMHETYLGYGLFHLYRLMSLAFFSCLIFFLESVVSKPNRIGKTLVWLGQWSLPIYFIHYYFLPSILGVHAHLAQYAPQQRISIELFIYSIGSLIALIPTIIVTYCIKQNTYLSLLLLGEKTKHKVE